MLEDSQATVDAGVGGHVCVERVLDPDGLRDGWTTGNHWLTTTSDKQDDDDKEKKRNDGKRDSDVEGRDG